MDITQTKIKTSIKKSLNAMEGILPFTEKPSNSYLEQKEENNKNEMKASELFSFFTADIIKEEVIFTR